MNEEHFVYIIAHSTTDKPEGPVKVGITKSLRSRLASVQTGNWRRLEIAHQFRLGSRELAFEVERRFHEMMAENRMAGEWFGIEPLHALEALCGVVCGVINDSYKDDDVKLVMALSGVDDNYRVVSDFYWGTGN